MKMAARAHWAGAGSSFFDSLRRPRAQRLTELKARGHLRGCNRGCARAVGGPGEPPMTASATAPVPAAAHTRVEDTMAVLAGVTLVSVGIAFLASAGLLTGGMA